MMNNKKDKKTIIRPTNSGGNLAWLLDRWEEMYDLLGLAGEGRHPVSAIEEVRMLIEEAEK